ncbi:MAG: hypothetical protein HUJ68_10250 [Clostridia bacterium]|nr:hypothetical protein [Clostridia bacterium]
MTATRKQKYEQVMASIKAKPVKFVSVKERDSFISKREKTVSAKLDEAFSTEKNRLFKQFSL